MPAPYTTESAVRTLLGQNVTTRVNLAQFVPIADSFIADLVECAAGKGLTLSDTKLELIARYAAAHFYTKTDPLYTSRSTNGASGSFLYGKPGSEPFKDMIKVLDSSGCAAGILDGINVDADWLGKAANEELSWAERNGDASSYY